MSGWNAHVRDLYAEQVAAQQARAEQVTYGYDADEALFYANTEPRVTFKQTLIMSRGYNQQPESRT